MCSTPGCDQSIVPDVAQSKWWRNSDIPVTPLVCAKCDQTVDPDFCVAFMVLFERDVVSVQQLMWLVADVCSAYKAAGKWMATQHLHKWDMASMVLKLMPLSQLGEKIHNDLTDSIIKNSLRVHRQRCPAT